MIRIELLTEYECKCSIYLIIEYNPILNVTGLKERGLKKPHLTLMAIGIFTAIGGRLSSDQYAVQRGRVKAPPMHRLCFNINNSLID